MPRCIDCPKGRGRITSLIVVFSPDEMIATTVYGDDYRYLIEHEIPIGPAIRYALSDYVAMMRARELTTGWNSLTLPEREAIIQAAVEAPHAITPPKEPAAAPRLRRISQTPPPDLSTWSKQERDAWILDGAIPRRFNNVIPLRVTHDF